MKLLIFFLTLLLGVRDAMGQYGIPSRVERFEILADVWGRLFLFHPTVSDSARRLNYYLPLMETLKSIDSAATAVDFVAMMNRTLIEPLEDPLTFLFYEGEHHPSSEVLDGRHRSRSILYDDLKNPVKETDADTVILDLRFLTDSASVVRGIKKYGWNGRRQTYRGMREHKGWYETGARKTGYSQYLAIDTIEKTQYRSTSCRQVIVLVNNASVSWAADVIEQAADTNLVIVWERTGKYDVSSPWIRNYSGAIHANFNVRITLYDADRMWHVPVVRVRKVKSVAALLDTVRQHSGKAMLRRYVYRAPSVNEVPISSVSRLDPELNREERLTGFIKMWVVLRFFYPHWDLAALDWTDVLSTWIPIIESTEGNEFMYQLAGILTDLRDSHMRQYLGSARLGSHSVPIRLETVANRILVAETRIPEVHVGDELLAIRGEPLADLEQQWRLLIPASRPEHVRLRLFGNRFVTAELLVGMPLQTVPLTFRRNNDTVHVEPAFSEDAQKFQMAAKRREPKLSEDSILYFMPGYFTSSQTMVQVIVANRHARGLILDLRGTGTMELFPIYSYLSDRPMKSPIFKRPVVRFNSMEFDSVTYRYNAAPQAFGGPMAVLTDGHLISAVENLCMTLKNAGRATFIGRPTAGCNGNISELYIVRGKYLWFTGMKVEYADGSPFQGIGIIPDYLVEPTERGLREGRDETLEKAYHVLREQMNMKR